MEREVLSKMLDVIAIMESTSIWSGSLGLIFERNTLNGVVYRNELGYCAFGDPDGQAVLVDVKGFVDLCKFQNILQAKKTIREGSVEFRLEDKSPVISRVGGEEINLKPWESGLKLELDKDEIFNAGSDLNYFLLGQKFCFSSAEFFGAVTLTRNPGMRVRLSPSFVKVFEIGWDVVKVVDEGVLFIKDDLEVMVRSGIEGHEEALEEKFEREASTIKSTRSFCIDNPEAFKRMLEAAAEMRMIGADMVGFHVEGRKLFLQAATAVGMRRVMDIPFTGTFAGSLFGSAIDLVWKLRDQLKRFYVDDVMVLCEGDKVGVICHLADRVVIEG